MKQIVQFLNEVKVELSRVQWPKINELIGATIVTLILVLFFTIYIGIVDITNHWIIYENLFGQIRR